MQAVFLYLFFIPFAALQPPQVFPLQNCQLCRLVILTLHEKLLILYLNSKGSLS